MGNRAKRKEVARLLKEHGMGRLYGGNKKAAWTQLRGSTLDTLRYKLQFKPGDIVHDCDALNHRLVKWLSYRRFGRWSIGGKSAWVLHLDQFEMEGPRWSCGCPWSPESALTREQVEAFMSSYVNREDQRVNGWLTPWHLRLRDALNKGDHICDEQGMLLPEFVRRENE